MSISYDSPAVLARFAGAHQITFPLLSDKGSAVIRRYGILNTNIPSTHTFYGIPFPGEYMVAPDGRVADKGFLPSLEDRGTASEVPPSPDRNSRSRLTSRSSQDGTFTASRCPRATCRPR